jgi:hypothetical protein
MIILHLEDVWGFFHASIDFSYNLFLKKIHCANDPNNVKEIF